MTHSIRILEGKEGIIAGYKAMLSEDSLDIICLSSSYAEVVGDFFDREYAPELYTRCTREILPDTKENRDYRRTKEAKNQVRFLKAKSETDVVIGRGQMLLVSFDKSSPFAILTTDLELIAQLRMQFEALWRKESLE